MGLNHELCETTTILTEREIFAEGEPTADVRDCFTESAVRCPAGAAPPVPRPVQNCGDAIPARMANFTKPGRLSMPSLSMIRLR